MLYGPTEGQEIDGSSPSHGGDMFQEGVSILKLLVFQYILFHPFKSMSNYGNTLWLQTSSQIPAPPLWFGSPRSPNVDKGDVYTIQPSSLNGEGAHEDQTTHPTIMYTLPKEVAG